MAYFLNLGILSELILDIVPDPSHFGDSIRPIICKLFLKILLFDCPFSGQSAAVTCTNPLINVDTITMDVSLLNDGVIDAVGRC